MKNEPFFQLFPPGMPDLTEPWAGEYEIVWDIYIRCNNRQKLRRVHIPALEAIIGAPHGGRGWNIWKEKENPEEARLFTVERLTRPYSDDMVISLLRKLYALKPKFWEVSAQLDKAAPYGVYVCALYAERESASGVPAISSAMVELTAALGDKMGDGSRS